MGGANEAKRSHRPRSKTALAERGDGSVRSQVRQRPTKRTQRGSVGARTDAQVAGETRVRSSTATDD